MSLLPGNAQFTTNIPLACGGRRLWFAHDDEIEYWRDTTDMSAEKRGTALRNRLQGAAAVYRTVFARKLVEYQNGGGRLAQENLVAVLRLSK